MGRLPNLFCFLCVGEKHRWCVDRVERGLPVQFEHVEPMIIPKVPVQYNQHFTRAVDLHSFFRIRIQQFF